MTLNEQKLYEFIQKEFNKVIEKDIILYRFPDNKNGLDQANLYQLGYQFLGNTGHSENNQYVNQIDDYLSQLQDYFNLSSPPPRIVINDKKLKRKILNYWIKLKPTQAETNKVFEGFFQYFNYSDLFNLSRTKYTYGDKTFILQLLNIDMDFSYIDHKHVFKEEEIKNTFRSLGFSIFPSRFKTHEVQNFLAHLTPYFEDLLYEQTSSHYGSLQEHVLNFIQETIPADEWYLFSQYYPTYVTSQDNIASSLFSDPVFPSLPLNLEHSYITHQFPNLLVQQDIHRMNSYLSELLLIPEHAKLLNISNIIIVSQAQHQKEDQTQLIIYSADEKEVNRELFTQVYLHLIEVFAHHKKDHKDVTIEDCKQAILYFQLNQKVEAQVNQSSKPKI